MRHWPSWAFLSLVALFALSGAAYGQYRYSNPRESAYRAGYDQGYRDGLSRGVQDYRSGRIDNRDRDYGNRGYSAGRGYPGTVGGNEEYRRGYRAGYQAGYNDGIYGGSNGLRRYPGGGQNSYPGQPPNARMPGGAYPGYYRNGYDFAYDRGMERGYQDGLKKGDEDFRKSRSYDLNRHKDYRNADKGYKSSYGARRDYQAGYRNGFEEGYRRSFGGYWR